MKWNLPLLAAACVLAVESLIGVQWALADGTDDTLSRVLNADERVAAPAALAPASNAILTPVESPAIVHADHAASNLIRLSPDRTQILHLDEDAASVVVSNPDHASVVLDSPRLLVLMPRLPGSTSFTVLNAKGAVILQKDVVVTGTEKHYVRVRRACNSGDTSCASSSYFYCPDGCYEVSTVAPDGGAAAPEITGGNAVNIDALPVPDANRPPPLPQGLLQETPQGMVPVQQTAAPETQLAPVTTTGGQ